MGWASGSTLCGHIIETVQFHVPDAETRGNMYVEIISAFEAADCDTLDECMGVDPVFDEQLRASYDYED